MTDRPDPLARFVHALNSARLAARSRGVASSVGRLAPELGLSKSTLYNYLNGKSLPSATVLRNLLLRLKMSDQDVLDFMRLRDEAELFRAGRHAEYGEEPSVPTAPHELPLAPQGFVGRTQELADLDGLLEGRGTAPGVVISAVSGTAGVGKTALAVHWSHGKVGYFPDGQLHVDLRGYDPDRPLSSAEALAILLRSLGVDGDEIPEELPRRVSMYRTKIAGRRLLLVLDNAHSAEQVRPLLPGSPTCFVVITSRDMLSGLVAREGVRRLELDLFPLEDAISLLALLVGERVEHEPEAAATLAARCARLPLALRIAAELVASRTRVSLAALVTELEDEQRRLDLLEVENDPRAAVRSVVSWSYGYLPPELQSLFRLIGLSPARSHDHYGLAALGESDLPIARTQSRALIRASLLWEKTQNRFEAHDLLRLYGRELSIKVDTVARGRDAMHRLAEHFVFASAQATERLHSKELTQMSLPRPGVALTFTSDRAALDWLEAERENMVLTCKRASEFDLASTTSTFSFTLQNFLDGAGYYDDAIVVHSTARVAAKGRDPYTEAAATGRIGLVRLRLGNASDALGSFDEAIAMWEQQGDSENRARMHGNKGLALDRLGRFEEALVHHRQALSIHRGTGDHEAEATGLANMANTMESLGQYTEALGLLPEALHLYEELGDKSGQGRTLNNMGVINYRIGEYEAALKQFRAGLCLKSDLGDRLGEGNAHSNIGITLASLGRDKEALVELEQARELAREVGESASLASITNSIASVSRALGDRESALREHAEALTVSKAAGDRGLESEILNDLGMTLRLADRLGEAAGCHQRSLTLAKKCGNPYEQARALDGLAAIYDDIGRPEDAQTAWREALELFEQLGVPQAERVRTTLERLG